MDHIINIDEWIINFSPIAALAIGILSIPHCVGMCGPISVNISDRKSNLVVYQAGRLLGYLFIIMLTGLISNMLLSKLTKYMNIIASILIGLSFIYMGYRIFKGHSVLKSPKIITKLHSYLLTSTKDKGSLGPAFLLGSCSVFLPCGILYTVIFSTLALENFLIGLLCILLFWLGSLPATFFAPHLFRRFIDPLARRKPRLLGTFLILIGLVSVANRGFYQVIKNWDESGKPSCQCEK